MKLPKLNQRGIAHILAPLLFIVIFAAIGSYLLLRSHALVTCACGGGYPTNYNGNIYSGYLSVWWDGTSPSTIYPPSGFTAELSNMSFDGTQVAYFTGDPSTKTVFSTIYKGTITYYNNPASKASLTLSNISTIGNIPSGSYAISPPMWSPDGTKVAVVISSGATKTTSGITQIWVANTNGSGGHVVPNIPSDIEPYMSWRPASVNIMYVEPHPTTGNQICTISTGGLNKSCHSIPRGTVQVGGYLGEAGLAVSPDGSKVALADYNYSTTGAVTSGDIYTVNSDGSGLKRLSTFAAGKQANAVVWSPDGTKIAYLLNAYSSATPSNTGTWVMNAADGSGKTQISNTSYNFYPPSLSWAIATGK